MGDIEKFRFRIRRRTAANWTALNEILLDSEFGIESGNPRRLKIGDGVTAWNDLPYVESGLALALLRDVDIADRADKKALTWDAASGKHVYRNAGKNYSAGDGIAFDVTNPDSPIISSTYGSIALSGRVANYAALPSGLGSGGAGKAYVLETDGLAYIWNGSAYPLNGKGLFVGIRGSQVRLQNTILDLSPKAYWPCQETSGSTLTDATGNGYNLTLKGTNTLAQPCSINGGVALYSPTSSTSANGASGAHQCGIAVPWTGDITWIGFCCPINNATCVLFTVEAAGETLATNIQFNSNFTANNQTMFHQALWEYGAGVNETINALWAPYNIFGMYALVKKASSKTVACYFNGVRFFTGTFVNDPAGGTTDSTYLHSAGSSQAQASSLGSNYAVFNRTLTDAEILSIAKASGLV